MIETKAAYFELVRFRNIIIIYIRSDISPL